MELESLQRLIAAILAKAAPFLATAIHPHPIPVGVSNRHVHLAAADLENLYGAGHQLQPQRELTQPGQFAAAETVILAGPKGCLERVRVLGPVRKRTQVEISRTDAIRLGLSPPVRESGDLEGTSGLTLIGPKGTIQLKEGLIIARRHVHMSPADAVVFGVKDGESVRILAGGERGLVFDRVTVRVDRSFSLELHLDTDEANAAGLGNGETVRLLTIAPSGPPGMRESTAETGGEGRREPVTEILALVTEQEVRRARRRGGGIHVRKGGLVTPLARDTAKELGVEIIDEVR